jgi:hypothetical protein
MPVITSTVLVPEKDRGSKGRRGCFDSFTGLGDVREICYLDLDRDLDRDLDQASNRPA